MPKGARIRWDAGPFRHPRAVPFAVCKYTFTANFIPLVGMRTLSLHVGRTLNVVFRAKPRIGCQS